ncbi:gamma-glutamyltransferase [Halopseudomonas nanhaiensis]|uniref:gamma-glutamyltransferase n=1 Tax=Halopseudomonas nanhaiensis TaxID=2830842 RepID=UPI001CBB4506|nr:gamma-glutamyltransferase [Halopseudomonas nanhaiensis]UAW98282.1 gamma-glutamyltransferase [Halopseudomonas nanhaiensis]
MNTLRGALFTLGLLISGALDAAAPEQQAVATAHPLSTDAAHRVLDQGGNAFDAAIAAAATLAVVEPQGSGLGGGGFFLLRLQDQDGVDYRFLDARETAPLAAHRDMYRDADGKVSRQSALDGPLAAGIPGLPAALVHLAEHYGQLPLSTSLAPAIRAAEEGFEVGERYRMLGGFRLKAMRTDPETARIYLRDGELPAVGTLLRQPELAATLRALAQQGRDGFYAGPIAERMVEGVRAAGGIWQEADLSGYRIIEREPIRWRSQGHEIISAPLPSAGGIALAGILQGLDHLPATPPGSAQRTHQLVELMRRVYRDRAVLLGDADQIDVPVARLISAEYAHALADGISAQRATPSSELGAPQGFVEGTHTTHFSLIDSQGNAVAATLSINLPFGAAFTVPGTGVLLNNEMDDFAADPSGRNAYGLAGSEANAIAPGKRPLSSMTPTMLENDQRLAVLGTPGGSRIITMVLLGSMEAMDGQPVEHWVSRPRFHHQYLPDHIQIEDGAFTPQVRSALERLGHRIEPVGREYGDMQAVNWDKRQSELSAASDPRGEGKALVRRALRAD